MRLSKEAAENKPKKPLNVYFKFRSEKLALYKDEEGKVKKANKDWENIDPKLKEQMESKFHE